MLKSIDFLDSRINFSFYDQSKHASIAGGILTIIISTVSVAFGIMLALELFEKKQPKSYLVERFENDVAPISTEPKGLFHLAFHIDFKTNQFEPDTRIYNYTARLEYTNGTIVADYKYDKCDEEELSKLTVDLESFYYRSTCVCVSHRIDFATKKVTSVKEKDFIYPVLSGGYSSMTQASTRYIFNLKQCVNSTENNNSCASKEEIRNRFIQTPMGFSFIDNYFDITNYNKPIQSYLNTIYQIPSEESLAYNNLIFQSVVIKTQDGLIFDNMYDQRTFRFDNNDRTVDKKVTEEDKITMFKVILYIQSMTQNYDRTYVKLQEVLANIGGIVKMLLLLGEIINYVFREYQMILNVQSTIMNRVANLPDAKQICNVNDPSFDKNSNQIILKNMKNIVSRFKEVSNDQNVEKYKTNVSFTQYLWQKLSCRKKNLYTNLIDYRTHIMNEISIFDLYFDNFKIKKYLFQSFLNYENNTANLNSLKINHEEILKEMEERAIQFRCKCKK